MISARTAIRAGALALTIWSFVLVQWGGGAQWLGLLLWLVGFIAFLATYA